MFRRHVTLEKSMKSILTGLFFDGGCHARRRGIAVGQLHPVKRHCALALDLDQTARLEHAEIPIARLQRHHRARRARHATGQRLFVFVSYVRVI